MCSASRSCICMTQIGIVRRAETADELAARGQSYLDELGAMPSGPVAAAPEPVAAEAEDADVVRSLLLSTAIPPRARLTGVHASAPRSPPPPVANGCVVAAGPNDGPARGTQGLNGGVARVLWWRVSRKIASVCITRLCRQGTAEQSQMST